MLQIDKMWDFYKPMLVTASVFQCFDAVV